MKAAVRARVAPRCGPKRRSERGATLVEFALILPIFVMLLFGMITGGMAYNRNLAMSYSAQQTARWAATLPISNYASTDAYLDALHNRLVAASEGHLTQGVPSRSICVAVHEPGEGWRSRRVGATDGTVTRLKSRCFDDRLTDGAKGDPRAQVSIRRGDSIDLVFQAIPVTLSRQVSTRLETT